MLPAQRRRAAWSGPAGSPNQRREPQGGSPIRPTLWAAPRLRRGRAPAGSKRSSRRKSIPGTCDRAVSRRPRSRLFHNAFARKRQPRSGVTDQAPSRYRIRVPSASRTPLRPHAGRPHNETESGREASGASPSPTSAAAGPRAPARPPPGLAPPTATGRRSTTPSGTRGGTATAPRRSRPGTRSTLRTCSSTCSTRGRCWPSAAALRPRRNESCRRCSSARGIRTRHCSGTLPEGRAPHPRLDLVLGARRFAMSALVLDLLAQPRLEP